MFPLAPSRADQARNAASRTERLRRRSHEACERPMKIGATRGDEHLKHRQESEADCKQRLVKA